MTDLTKIDTPFGELDDATKGALLLAEFQGKVIEMRHGRNVAYIWCVMGGNFVFADEYVYRVHSTPAVMGSVTMRGRGTREYGFFPGMCSSEFKMTCTFPTRDGLHVPGVYTSPDGLQIVIEVAE